LIPLFIRPIWHQPIVLIDEYDTPIHSGYLNGDYNDVVGFIHNFFGAALKTNPYLHKAVLTGILRISKESLFSDLNNVEVYSLLRSEYGEYFGFTEEEVKQLLAKAKLNQDINAVREWYNGYLIGGKITVYNPWSIVNCIKRKGELQPYWVNTSDNTLIKQLLIQSSADLKRNSKYCYKIIDWKNLSMKTCIWFLRKQALQQNLWVEGGSGDHLIGDTKQFSSN